VRERKRNRREKRVIEKDGGGGVEER